MKTVTKTCVLAFTLSLGLNISAQSNRANLAKIAHAKDNTDWIKFKANNLSALSVITDNKEALGLNSNDEFRLIRKETDALGFTHYRFQQLYKAIPVEGGDYIIHERNGAAATANGKLVYGLDLNITPAISDKTAVEYALQTINADSYLWEDKGAEQLLKKINKDENATFYPKAELVIAKNTVEEDAPYTLAYKVNIFASQPVIGQTIYIDAVTGKVVNVLNLIHTTEVPATAVTKYKGVRTIKVDSVSPTLFRLRETSRGGGIETYNVNKGVLYSNATDFIDADNYWNNVNANLDEVATDAHWGAEMTYDYFLQKHNRNSFDNKGTLLASYVHFSNSYVNAFWNGSWMTYGDGNATYAPLTPLDVCGHEVAHGVTSKSAALIYAYESGALNESFSDIFGTAIEFFSDASDANWEIGEDLGTAFRSMENPNSKSNPDTYKGQYWAVGSADEGGVHTNSGVQNFWFYLLTLGGNGTNDHGRAYNVTGIGMEAAAKIAYRNLTVYLTTTSQYIDARQGSIWAAEDLYGICSAEAIQTANAWAAVGVGDPLSDKDISIISVTSPATACGLTNSENVSILLRYNGCSSFAIGDTIPVAYKINSLATVIDTIILAAALMPGDSLNYTFSSPADLSVVGTHTVKTWLGLAADTLNFNDTIKISVIHKLAQNVDVGISSIISPTSNCQLTATEAVQVKLQFFGCDSLKTNDSIVMAYRIDGGSIIKDTVILSAPLYANQTTNFTFKKTANLSTVKKYKMDVWANYSKDNLHGNDSILGYSFSTPFPVKDKEITFEDNINVVDSFYVVTNSMSQAYVSTLALKAGKYGFQMTGGNWYANRKNYKGINDLNTWTVNPEFSSKICFCVDASTWTTANVAFDMKQTFNTVYSANRGYTVPFTSNLRLLVNGTQIGKTYMPFYKSTDPYRLYSINLDAYAGTKFELCFEGKNYQSKAYDSGLGAKFGDNVYLDNIFFSAIPVDVKEIAESTIHFEVYPNPGKDLFTLSCFSKNAGIINIEVVDMLGRKIYDRKVNVNQGTNSIPLEIKGQQAGIYIISVLSPGNKEVKKLIIE